MGAAKQGKKYRGSEVPITYKRRTTGFSQENVDVRRDNQKELERIQNNLELAKKPVKHVYVCFERNYVTPVMDKANPLIQKRVTSDRILSQGERLVGETCDWEVFGYGKIRAIDKGPV